MRSRKKNTLASVDDYHYHRLDCTGGRGNMRGTMQASAVEMAISIFPQTFYPSLPQMDEDGEERTKGGVGVE